jgi:hypothetical protein
MIQFLKLLFNQILIMIHSKFNGNFKTQVIFERE